MKRANTMSTITVELTIKVKTKFIPSNAEKTNGFISPQMSNFHRCPQSSECCRKASAHQLDRNSFEHWARKMVKLHLLRQVHCHLGQQKNRRDVFAKTKPSPSYTKPKKADKSSLEDSERLISETAALLSTPIA